MTREDLKKTPGFTEWASEGQGPLFLSLLAEVVDVEVGMSGYGMHEAHYVHVNFGIQDATRRVRHILKDPTGVRTLAGKPTLPPARYGVKPE